MAPEESGLSRRRLLRDAAVTAAGVAIVGGAGLSARAEGAAPLSAFEGSSGTPPLNPAPGTARSWEPSLSVHSGSVNLATGNLTLFHSVTGWGGVGPGVSFGLVHNAQGSFAGTLGAKWSHSYDLTVTGGQNAAVVRRADGREDSFALAGGVYSPPTGSYDRLVKNGDGTWTLTSAGSVRKFDAAGKLTRVEDANGVATTLTYAGGVLSAVTDAYGRALTFAYAGGKIASVTDSESRTWTFAYDAAGRLASVTDPALGGQLVSTGFAYDGGGRVNAKRNRLNRTWTYAYDAAGLFATTTDPLGNVAGIGGAAQPAPDQRGFASAEGAAAAQPDNIAATYPVGTVATVYLQDPAGNPSEYGMDSGGRTTASRDGLGNQTNYAYDAANNRTAVIEPGGATTSYAFDAKGNVTSVTDPTGKTTTSAYDASGNLVSVTDPGGRVTTHAYDARANLVGTVDPTGRTANWSYRADGALLTATDGAGKVTSYAYDAQGNQTSVTDPLGNVTTFAYVRDRVASRTDARGRTTSYSYDAWGRTVGIAYPQSAAQAFAYDAEGSMLTSVDGTGSRSYGYDALGRKTTQTDPRGATSATYDAASRLTSQTDVSGRTITYQYDANSRLTRIADGASWAQYQYDPRGRVSRTDLSNGIFTVPTYDAAGRVTGLQHKRGFNTLLAGYAAEYDGSGNLTRVTESPSGDVTTIGYDAAGRVTSESRAGANPYTGVYAYDAAGRRSTAYRSENGVASHDASYAYDDAGRLVLVTDAVVASGLGGAYAWNPDGTLASFPGPGYVRNLGYDEEGRLTSIRRGSVLAFEYAYGFDGGRRWRRDLAGNEWEWFPCGVACGSGELVRMSSDLSGGSWAVESTSLTGVRTGSSYPLPAPGGISRVTDGQGNVTATPILDAFGVLRGGALPGVPDDEGTETLFALMGGAPPKGGPIAKILPFMKRFGPGIIIGRGTPMVLCEAALVDIAKTLPHQGRDGWFGWPSCPEQCAAIALWEDASRNRGWPTIIANWSACLGPIVATQIACGCKKAIAVEAVTQ